MSTMQGTADLTRRLANLVGFNSDEMIQRTAELHKVYLEAKSTHEYENHMRKVILSEMKNLLREEATTRVTETKLEDEARASEPYKTQLLRLRKAGTDLAHAQAAYMGARDSLEFARSKISFAKEEMRL